MYRPPLFASEDRALALELVRAHPFGALVGVVDGRPVVNHVPFVVYEGALHAHLARANPMAAHLDQELLVDFLGPHAYVSPRWYRAPEVHVPTWNYVEVQVRGRGEVLPARPSLDHLVAAMDPGWSPGPGADSIARGVVAFRVPLTEVELKLKLSQNREPEDAQRVVAALEAGSVSDRALVAWMRRVLGPPPRG